MIRASTIVTALAGSLSGALGQSATPVTVDNFVRAESDSYLANFVQEAGGLGKLLHRRDPASIDQQSVIRLNRDTLYSSAVFDLDAGPVTVTLPDAGKRFMSLMSVSQDHYAATVYGAGTHRFTRDKVGTRYVLLGIRTFVDPNDPADLRKVHALQDAVKVSQKNNGKLELPRWDAESRKKVRDALLVLGSTLNSFDGAFGSKAEVDPVRHLIGTAAGWGGNPEKDAKYLNVTPARNDGSTVYKLNVKNVPVNAFWSVSVYDAQGYYEKNPYNAYSLNSITASRGGDGSATIQFGGCDGKIPNCLPIMKGWNYTVRLYRPRAEILSGKWTFPEPQPVN
ncbi:conserved hypothetical protein [Hyphomicrobiales bacterium]|nr:conserved hypothetical protein [Hyphomicrobiales bacterium]CAH1699812.1 Carboxylesterase [Hyphomicrobiales bacterium]CAI0343542.1 DUF1254 domain-containing protein [Hyphomicrobiales bacterium]